MPLEKGRSAAITGHRSLHVVDGLVIHVAMESLLKNKTITRILFGGAVGTDTSALRACIEQRAGLNPNVELVVVVPDTLQQQPTSTHCWTTKADKVIELKNPISSDDRYLSYKKRNEYLVDNAEVVIAFFNGKHQSGTGSAMRYATKTGKRLVTIPISGLS